MHAQWQEAGTPPPAQYTITFDSHGGSAVAAIPANVGTAVGEPTDPTRTGYTFTGWHSAASGGMAYTWPYTLNASVTMHAQWTAITYTVAYNANSGSGSMATSTHTYDIPKNLSANTFTRSGYSFGGWNTAANGGGKAYAAGAGASNLSSAAGATVTLYAQWIPHVTAGVTVWVNEDDGAILGSGGGITISKSNSGGNPSSFTASVTSGYADIRWYLNGAAMPGDRGAPQSVTIDAADYANGNYILGVMVYKDNVPYSTDIHFTVVN
jgi:uncharacterized repeat protein (TIGR02543 family)